MEPALALRLMAERGQPPAEEEALAMLAASPLVEKLTRDWQEHPLFAVFRVMGLCEIPFAARLPYTQKLLAYIDGALATPAGFSCLGGEAELVPCYNAMLLEAYCRLGLAQSGPAQAALDWIKCYQLFERDGASPWPHKGVCKHGGCLGRVPCYIGVGKSVRALAAYIEFTGGGDPEAERLLRRGTAYMLRHSLYRRLGDGQPISAHILDLMLPQSYALSLTDLLYIVGRCGLAGEPGAAPLLDLLRQKQAAPGRWKIDSVYSYRGYVAFEGRRRASEWLSALLPLWLGEAVP